MGNKIEVGEYIRTTEDGIIGKVKRIELDEIDKSLKWYVFDKIICAPISFNSSGVIDFTVA